MGGLGMDFSRRAWWHGGVAKRKRKKGGKGGKEVTSEV